MDYTWEEVLEAIDNAEIYETEDFKYEVVGFTSTGKKISLGVISREVIEVDGALVYFLREVKLMARNKIERRNSMTDIMLMVHNLRSDIRLELEYMGNVTSGKITVIKDPLCYVTTSPSIDCPFVTTVHIVYSPNTRSTMNRQNYADTIEHTKNKIIDSIKYAADNIGKNIQVTIENNIITVLVEITKGVWIEL